MTQMEPASSIIWLPILVWLVSLGVFIWFMSLVVRALRKYISSGEQRTQREQVRRSLAAVLKENRQRCGMTQELVAESLGVSRQAVSKWERGDSEPSTSNLLALAKLYGIPAEELLRQVTE